ncbi:MAG: hypothetical protein IIC00_16030, partial [Planctomycetes bacterium]|nr:hypothetical protein [Planctomycetota bacterium]
MNHRWLNTGRTKRYGIAFGDGFFMSSPPSRSQIGSRARCRSFAESGFGGWADEKIKTARKAVPYYRVGSLQTNTRPIRPQPSNTEPKKISSTTFDNTSTEQGVLLNPVYLVANKRPVYTREMAVRNLQVKHNNVGITG